MIVTPVYLVDGKRSPQVKSGFDFKDVDAPYLAIPLMRHLMDKYNLSSTSIDNVVIGNTGTPAKYPNIARVVALMAGLDKSVPAYTVHRNCAAGMEALAQGMMQIETGRAHLLFAGGTESMTKMPLMFSQSMTDLFASLFKAKTPLQKLLALIKFRPHFLAPVIAIQEGLTDPFSGHMMGMTAEILARELDITREEQDRYADESHKKTVAAIKAGKFKDEIIPVIAGKKMDRIIAEDIGPRENSTVEGLAKMRPYFDRVSGSVTIGNSCPITDGASLILMASEEGLRTYNLKPMAKIHQFQFKALEPERMGIAPLLAIEAVLKSCKLKLEDIDLFEINEAFAAQILSILKASKSDSLAKRFGLEGALGEIPLSKLNVNGGGIALGHPVGSTGSRIVVTLMHELRRSNKRFGLASLCIGGGLGGAVIIENLDV